MVEGTVFVLNAKLYRPFDEFGRSEATWLPYWSNRKFVTPATCRRKRGFAVTDDLEVVSAVRSSGQCSSQPVEHTQLRYRGCLIQIFEQAGDMLGRLWEGVPLEQKRIAIPLVLCERES